MVIDTSAIIASIAGKPDGQPLLFKGNDFSRTDVISALAA